jgi:hypothetical protein
MKPRKNPLIEKGIQTTNPDAFSAPNVFNERKGQTKAELVRLMRKQTAAEFVGELVPNVHRFGLSKGQFSLIDLIDVITQQTGPVELSLSTWTAARADLARLEGLLATRFTSVRFLLDFSFQRRQPALIAQIRKLFGDGSIVVTRNHAKFLLVKRDNWRIVVRTSMNLNFNPRLEDVEIKDDPALYDFLDAILCDLFKRHDTKNQIKKSVKELGTEFAELEA